MKKLVLKIYLDPGRDADIVEELGKIRKPHRGEFVRNAIRAALFGESAAPRLGSPFPRRKAVPPREVSHEETPLDGVFG